MDFTSVVEYAAYSQQLNGLASPGYQLGGEKGDSDIASEISQWLMDRGAASFLSFIMFIFREESLHFITKFKFTDGEIEDLHAYLYVLQCQRISSY